MFHYSQIIPAPCQRATFKMGVKAYDDISSIYIPGNEYYGKDTRWIKMSYSTTKVKISTTSRLIEFASFVSSIGGNLGLFVGFSFISMFFFIYDQLEKHIGKIF